MTDQKLLLDDLSPDFDIVQKVIPLDCIIAVDVLDPTPEFIASVQRFGVFQPVMVRPAPDDKYYLISGRRRYRASLTVGLETIPAIIIPAATSLDASVLSLEANIQRAENPVAEYRAIKRLLADGYTETNIKESLGITVDRLHRMLTLDVLGDEILGGVQEGKIAVSTALRMAKLSDPYRSKLIDLYHEKGKLLGKDVSVVKRAVTSQSTQEVFDALEQHGFQEPALSSGAGRAYLNIVDRLMIDDPSTDYDKGWNAALVAIRKEENDE